VVADAQRGSIGRRPLLSDERVVLVGRDRDGGCVRVADEQHAYMALAVEHLWPVWCLWQRVGVDRLPSDAVHHGLLVHVCHVDWHVFLLRPSGVMVDRLLVGVHVRADCDARGQRLVYVQHGVCVGTAGLWHEESVWWLQPTCRAVCGLHCDIARVLVRVFLDAGARGGGGVDRFAYKASERPMVHGRVRDRRLPLHRLLRVLVHHIGEAHCVATLQGVPYAVGEALGACGRGGAERDIYGHFEQQHCRQGRVRPTGGVRYRLATAFGAEGAARRTSALDEPKGRNRVPSIVLASRASVSVCRVIRDQCVESGEMVERSSVLFV